MFEKYYEILELRKGSSKEQVKRAFRRKALLLHPDRNPGKNTSLEFLKVVEAYDALYNGVIAHKTSTEDLKKKEKEEKEERLKKAKAKAREAMRERREVERAFYRRIVNGFIMKYAYFQAFIFLLFSVFTFFNYFMPYQKVESYVQSKNMLYYYHLEEERAFISVCGNSYRTSISEFFGVKRGDPVTLNISFLFKDVMSVEFETKDGEMASVSPYESLYTFFPLMPILMLIPFLNLLYKTPNVRFYLLLFLNIFGGSAVLLYMLFDGGRLFRIFEPFSC